MAQRDLLQSLQSGKIPKKIRIMVAQGKAPIPQHEMLELLIALLNDLDSEISDQAKQTIASWDEGDILAQLQSRNCEPCVLEHFGVPTNPDRILRAIIANPRSPETVLAFLALTVSAHLLEAILDNRTRISNFPHILDNVRRNPSATLEIQKLIQEIETELHSHEPKDYAIEEVTDDTPFKSSTPVLEAEIPTEDLSLEGLPPEDNKRQAAISSQLSTLSVREKIRYALFGNREIRSMLVRDTNKEIARSVLHSPKITDNEIESISAMRGVADDVLREIGNNKVWTRSYTVVQNLVRNPKTPPLTSQRLLSRLRSRDLSLLTRDRSVSDAVRHNAERILGHRNQTGSGQ
jgi:hypothetical protein